MWSKVALALGSFYGMTGVVFGAIGSHALKQRLGEKLLASYLVGTRYQMFHALFLLILAVLTMKSPSPFLRASIVCAGVGVLFFSGSIYVLTILRWKVGLVTPIGGLFLITAWLLLMIHSFQSA